MISRMFLVALVACLLPGWGSGQSASATAQSSATGQTATPIRTDVIPKNPKDLMLLASQADGLTGMDQPWHMKVGFQTFDDYGKPNDQGVFEEWWAGPEKYKISYAGKGFSQIRYQNSNGQLMTGDADSPPITEFMLQWLLTHPVPSASDIRTQEYKAHDTKDGAIPLQCVYEKLNSPVVPTFCFTNHLPALRIEATHGGFVAYFNGIARFGGRYFANQLQVEFLGKPLLKANVTDLEPLTQSDDAIFTPPAGATAASPMPLVLGPSAIAKNRVSGSNPSYPAIAKAAHISGTVVIVVMISPAGEVENARAIFGPLMLQEAALDAVRTWKYKPYMVDGKPTEVRTDINVTYRVAQTVY